MVVHSNDRSSHQRWFEYLSSYLICSKKKETPRTISILHSGLLSNEIKKELEWNTNSNLHLFLKWLTLFFFNQKENHWWFFVVAIKSGRWRPPSTSVRLSCFWDSSTSSSKMKSSTVLLLSLSVALAMGQNYYLQFSGAPKEAPLYPPSANDVAPYYVADEVRPKQVHHFRWFSSLNRIQIRSPSIGKIWR